MLSSFNVWDRKNLYLFSRSSDWNQSRTINWGIKWNTNSKKSREITSNLEKKWERNKQIKSSSQNQFYFHINKSFQNDFHDQKLYWLFHIRDSGTQFWVLGSALYVNLGSGAKNLVLLQNQCKPSQLGNLSTLIK